MPSIADLFAAALERLRQGKIEEAADIYCQILSAEPDNAQAHSNLGVVLKEQGRRNEAADSYRRALELKPDFAEAHNNLGLLLREAGRLEEAVAACRRAAELAPHVAEPYNNLGNALKDLGRYDEAITAYSQALELRPDHAEAHNNLGIALKDLGRLDDAVASFRRALELRPDYAAAYGNLGAAHKDRGEADEAVACCRRAVELRPDAPALHSNLLYAQLSHPAFDARTLYEEHRIWDERHGAGPIANLPKARQIGNLPHDHRLRIGYISPDFREHVVGRNLLPLFLHHDRQQFEIFCYADIPRPDAMTRQFEALADHWLVTAPLDDAALAARIAADRIDILVDLALHMANNRLRVFSRRPAPMQATFAGYPGTTGLRAIDYRLTDPYLDPPDAIAGGWHAPEHLAKGVDEQIPRPSQAQGRASPTENPFATACYSEESIRLADTFWCFDVEEPAPSVGPLPAAERGYITFGSFNNFSKVNPLVLSIWSKVLAAVPDSRLVILAGEGSHRQRVLDQFAAAGISSERITFVARRPRQGYLEYYRDIDIGLETVPYNGHSTSLDAFWMGVPVPTLVGGTVVGRAGLSQLTNLGLTELIAYTPDHYVGIVAALAGDLPRLAALRATLRERMRHSPLGDAPRFARSIEAAYRTMWNRAGVPALAGDDAS